MKKAHVTGAAGSIGSHVVRELLAGNVEVRREPGLEFRPVEESIRDSIAWFRQHGYA